MDNTLSNVDAGLSPEQSAVQNSAAAGNFKLILVWLAVGLPLLWGAINALQDIGSLPL